MPSTRHVLAALALAVLAATAGCAGAFGTLSTGDATPASQTTNPADGASDAANAGSDGKSLTVGAHGEAKTDPDRAVLHVVVTATADSAEAARTQVADNASSLRSALADAGVDDANVTTERFNIRRDRRERREPRKGDSGESTYRATHAFAVEVADVDRVGELIELSVQNGANDIRHVEYTLSEETKAQLREEALRGAMDNARQDADVLAESASLNITGVRSVSTGGADVRPYRAELTAAAGGAADSATSIDSGPVTVTAQVTVTYDAAGA